MTAHAAPQGSRDSTARIWPEAPREGNPFVRDLERIQFSPFFSRLSAVTQVVSPTISGAPVHNRLTHTLKVAAIARTIAHTLNERAAATGIDGANPVCDPTVVEAACYTHDLGHPPFGHLGEAVLDRLAREELGLGDGFEGNAQTYRILVALDVTEQVPAGLNLTAAVRLASAKYPWPADAYADTWHSQGPPRGVQRRPDGTFRVPKYSAYDIDYEDLVAAREQVGAARYAQSRECAVMDVADDIAYSVHDIDDFFRSGMLDQATIAAEFRGWLEGAVGAVDAASSAAARAPGAALEQLRRKMQRDDAWIADDDAFRLAVETIDDELVMGLLSQPFDGSLSAERRLAAFTDRWIRILQQSVEVQDATAPRCGPVGLSVQAWHYVEVLKFVHKRFVLSRPDLAIHQRGLSRILTRSVRALSAWLDDDLDAVRAPRRLHELVELAERNYQAAHGRRTEGLDVKSAARARGVLDYVASLTDAQAFAFSEAISGRADRLWSVGQRL